MPEAIDPLLTPADSLLPSEPDRSDVSVLDETHTADTAPATLPEPLLDEPATSSPAPPSDVFLRGQEPVGSELELPLAPLDTPAVPDSAPRPLLGAQARARRGPYWEWALLGFSGTLLLVAMLLRQGGLPLFSAGLERPRPLLVTRAPLRPQPASLAASTSTVPPMSTVPPGNERPGPPPLAPEHLPASKPSAAPTTARKHPPKSARRRTEPKPARAAAAPTPPTPQRAPARDSVRAGLAQELP